MATEANIQESVLLKKGEREENALTSESFEEKATELPGNQVKQLETSSLVATTVYTPLETGTGKPTDESGIFFQALSVTMVIADEHSNTPESYKAAKPTEPEEETIKIGEKAIQSEVCGNSVPEKSETDSVEQGKKEAFNVSEKNQGDGYGVTSSQDAVCEDIKETTEEHAAVVADFKEQDLNETPREFVKEETDDKSVDAQEASELSEIGSKDTEEQKYEESVKKIEQDEEIEDTKPDVEIAKTEQNGLLQAITPDACASTQTIPQVETTEHEEKEQVVNILEKDQDKDDVTRAQEVTVEGGLQEKTHHNDDNEREVVEAKESVEEDAADVCVSTLVKESTKNEEPDDEKAIEKEVCEENVPKKAELEGEVEISDSVAPIQNQTLSTIEKDQGGTDGVTSLQEPPCVDVEETTTVQHVTTTIDFKEQDLNEKPREFVKEETEDKSLDAQEANEECEKEAKEEIDQNSEESVKKIEKEEETEEIKPAITTDDCIMTETKSQVEKTEHEEENTQKDEGLKEKSDSPSIEEVCEETSLEKDEYVKEVKDSATETVTKDENEDVEKEQEVNVLETHEGKVDVTSAQDVTIEKDLQEKDHHNEDEECEVVTTEESTEKDTEVIRSSETTEQQMLTNAVPSDVCISTQTEPQEEATEKNDVEVLNENETLRKDEDQEKEQEICVTEKVQSGGDDVTSSENASNEQEQHAEEIKPSVETTEEKDVCIPTQIESQEKPTKNEESAIQNDGDQKEKSDDPSINEVCEENDLKKTESEEEIKPSDSSVVTTRESVIETTEETKSSDETKENIEQQGVLNVIPTDNDDGQTDKHESPLVEVVCEETSSKTAEPEDVKHSDGSSTTLNEKETPDKEESLEKEDDIKTSEVHGGGDDVTSLQNVSNDDIKETLTDQHDTNAAYVEEGQGVIAKPKEILIEEAEDRSIDAEELGQPNEQNVEETLPTISENPEDEIKKEDKDLSHESVEDTNDHTTKEEKCTLEQEHVKEHTDQDKVSTEKVTDLNETKEVEPKEEIIPSTALSASTEATSNSEKEKAEGEKLPTEDLEIVSEEQIPELVPKSEEPVLKETTETHVDEEKGTVTKEISSAEKTEVQSGGDAVTSSQNASDEEIQETMIGQHDTTVTFVEEGQGVSATPKEILIEEAEDKSIVPEEIPLELAQPSEQNVEEAHSHLSKSVTENPEDEIKKEDKELSHETVKDTNDDTTKEEKCTVEQEPVEVHSGQDEVSKEKVTDLNETSEVEPKEEITPSTSLETSTEDTPNTEKEKAESENLPIEDLKTVSEVQIPESVPELEEPTLKEKCIITETETQLDEEKGTVTEEISSDEKTQQTTEIKQETVKEVCEEASSEKAELEEEIKHSDSSGMKINEKEITFIDNEEKEVKISTESRSEDNLTSSQIEVSEEKEDLKEKNIHNEGDFIKSGEDVGEDIEENTEHVTATNVCGSTQIETREETIENEEKNGEKAIEHEEYEAVSREENLEKKQEDVEETKMGENATTNEEKDVCISTQNESQEEPTKNEENAIEPDGDQKEKSDNAVVKEVCEENESEGRQISDSFEVKTRESVYEDTEETKMGEHATTNEEKDVCISTQNESQEEPTKNEENAIEHDGDQKEKSDDAVVKEVCEENESEGRQISDSFEVKTRESVYEDTEETKSSDETKEDIQQQGVLNVITSDVSSSTQTETIEKSTASEENNDIETTEKPESPLVEVACETTKSEIVESEEGVKQTDILSTTLNENETLSKEEKQEKEDEIKTSEEVKGGGVELISSQNASGEDVKETTIDQHNTTVAHVEEGQSVSALPKGILVEETEDKDKSIDAEEVSLELEQPNEQNAEETVPCLTKSISDNQEDEIKKEDTHDNAADEDKGTLEHEPVEEHSSQDEVSKEKVTGLNETKEVEPQEDTPSISIKTSTDDTSKTISEVQIPELVTNTEESVLKDECFISETETHLDEEKSTITEEISSDEKTELTTEIKQESVKEVCEETSSEKTELQEGLKLSDDSNVKINEKEITTFKEDEQEKDQEVNTSAESQGGNNITSSQNEESEEKEELKEKNYHNEGNEGDFTESGERVEEDTREIKSSVETKDTETNDAEHVISTSSSTHIEDDEEAIEKDEKKDETAIENDKNETVSTEENLEKKQEDIKETNTGEHATTMAYFEEEQSLSTITKEAIGKAEEGDKSVIFQEKTEQCDEENVEREQKAEEYNDEIKPSVETTEEKDVCISTQTESHVEPTKKEENAIEPDGERKENPDNPFVKEVCEESDLTKTESEERQPSDSFDVKTTEEDTEETKSSDETKENKEQQGVLDVIATDVSGSTQTEHVEKTTASHEENDDEETIEQDKGQTEKPEIPLVEVACETTKSEIVESEEEVKQSNSFSTTLNENEILSKEEKLEKEDEIKTSEIEVGEVEVTSSQNASNDDVKETTLDQDITAVAHVEEGSGVSALPKEILIEEAEDKSVDAEEISLELGQPNEQNVEETLPCPTKSINDNLEDEIKKEDRDLSHESVEDTNDDTKEERRTLEHEHLEEHSGQDEVSKEKVTDLHETTEAELKEDITPSISLETSTEDASNLENEKAEVESFPIENLETVSEVQIPELVPGSEETVLKNECLTSETETHLDEEKESITENNSSDEVSKELEQTKEQNVEETEACVTETISEKTEDKITKDEDSSHDRTDHINENITKEEKCFPDVMTKEIDISTLKHEPVEEQNDSQDEVSKEILTVSNETIAVEPKEDITPSSSLGTSAEDTSNSDKAKTVSESLPLEDLESVSEVHIPDVMPKSEDLKMEEECLVSETETYANEENRVATKEISSYENLETHGSTQQPENSYSTTENQLNSAEDCIKTEKDVILTKEVPLEIEKEKEVSDFKEQIVEEDTYSPELEEKSAQNQKETVHEISVENPEVTEVNVDAQIGQKDLQGKEDISCVSKVTTDITDQEPKEEKSPSLEDGATLESVDLSNTDSTAYPSESEKLATRALESDCDVQIPEVVADSEDSKVKEECIVLEQDTKTNEISSALDKEEENVTKAPTESDEAKSSDLIIEENASTKEASEQCDDVAKDKIEQPEEGVNKPVNSCSETTEGSIKEEEPYAENKEIETELEAENQADRTEDRTEMTDETVLTEKVSKELEQTKEQNVEETEACVTEDKITKDEDSSPDSTEHINENITKEEKCFPDVMTKETDISTLKHEPVEEQNDSQDEVPKEILTVSNETIAVEPKEDIPPSSSLGTSAQNQKETVHEISVENPEVTEVNVDAQIGQKDLQGKEDISCVSKVTNDITDQEENASTKENREIHGELEPTYEPVIEEQVTIETKPQLEQSDITSENITNDQTSESKLEHTSAKDTEEDDRLAPEIETKGIENLHETTKNIILTDEEVAVETEKEKERNEIEKQVSDTELDSTPTPVQKELANEIEYSKPIPVGNIEVTEVKAESQIEVENTQAAEDLSCLSKASSVTEKSKAEIREDPQQTITVIGEVKDDIVDEASEEKIAPVLEDSKASERQVNLPEIESTDTPSNGRDTMKLEEDVSCKTRETIEEQIALTSQLADREILEEKDDKPISERSSSRTDELLGTKDSVEDTKDAKFTAENLSVTDETITEIKKSNEDSEIVASEFKKSEDTVTEKEKETLDEPHTDDSEKPTYDSILSSEIATEAAKIVPECINAPAILTDNLPEASPEMLLAKPEDKITEDPEVLPSVEKDVTDVQKHEKDLDHETEVKTADVVSNVECSEIEPRHFDTNQVNQKDKKKEADESIKDVIPVEDVKTSTRELEVGSVDLEVPSVIDATADDTNYKTLEVHEAGLLKDDKHLESACDQSKSIEEGSGIKQEPLKLDASETLDTAAAEDLTISQKYVPDDLINISQTHPEVQNREVPACTVDKQSPKESTEVKILTEKMDTSDEQAEPVAKSLVPEAGNLKVNTTVSVDQKEKSESVEKEESGVKTDEEDEEEEDHEEDEKTGSCSDAPVMVEASQDMEVKAHKKSHNILSGVGSKVKHSIAKVKKAITGKSSPTKSTSPKAKNQVTG
ncbi:hypothetical protein HanRHA438_Chr09g0398181 [Helianthus annuus]|uniref:Uncharacterized protein n=1 Tax=Helianthus annuus TaxID=4232 RepID=A0A9K3I5J8_HELAN|nr:hypothetical protein HanXRQr2_Chr09g0386521 [Helianthus annuus]KAJ0534196.1 hypothetical protein HanIR_Chr09g0417001 [Helianthus annuus]KAJ0888094.1 hypothetical protein HanRHA438_Chr09g0398181 [Helianthus annuus]KAJ0892991.1 hypothetical protein HanPSC8_Chr09g0372501 [Helianthus annuus]